MECFTGFCTILVYIQERMRFTVQMGRNREDNEMSTKSSTVEIGGLSYITTDELAQRLGVSAKTIWRWQNQGFLPALVKIGRVRLYREDRLTAWLATYENN
jgi:excisionase family DNA binding protein